MKRFIYISVLCLVIAFLNCSEDEVICPTQEDGSPIANIIHPDDGSSYLEGSTIEFIGIGTDEKDGILPEDSLIWISDKDGTLGLGDTIRTDNLSVNTHVITFTATDSDGNADSDDITIHVISDYELISVHVTSGYPMGWEGGGVPDDEKPVHAVFLDGFQIGKYEITYALWTDVMSWAEANGYTFENDGRQGAGDSTTDQHPVTQISWRDCIAWCNAYSEREGLTPVYYTTSAKTTVYSNSSTGGDIGNDCVDWSADGFRLPTEAEWEYAARYIDGTNVSSGAQHSGYNLYPDVDDCAWIKTNSGSGTHAVGQLQANSLGAYDMSGNVFEWCWDWYAIDYYSYSPSDNPIGPDSGNNRVLRSGSWDHTGCHATSYRYRSFPHAGAGFAIYGFRVCRGVLIL